MRSWDISRIHFRLLALTALALPFGARAALVWDTQEISLDAQANTREIVANYHFKNTGSAAVTITEIVSSCDCTTVELTKRIYAAGEGGTLITRLAVGSQAGLQENTLAVITDDTKAEPVVLRFRANIQSLVTLSPPVLSWHTGAEPKEGSTLVTAAGPLRIASLVIMETHPAGVAARVEMITAGTEYRIVVRPPTAAGARNLAVSCSANFTDGTAQDFVIYGLIPK